MSKFYAYIYYDPSRQMEPIYVGKGQGRRSHSHLKRADMHPFTQRLQCMMRNGVEPVIRIIPCDDEELAFLVEEEGINKFGRKDLGLGSLLNLTDGGEGVKGITFPEAELLRRREYANTPEFKAAKSAEASERMQDPFYKAAFRNGAESKETADKRAATKATPEFHAKASASASAWMSTPEGKRAVRLGQQKVKPAVCPHCQKAGRAGAMQRWHFENCKFKK